MITNTILQGDCLEKLKELPDNSVDAIITDPPYGLAFMGKEWDTFNEYSQEKQTKPEEYKSLDRVRYYRPDGSPVFWNKPTYVPKEFKFVGENQSKKNELMENFFYYWAKECLRVLKHGGYLLSFGGTRTYHRMTCGIEDAGFEIRDCIMWVYGSGFPKSLNIGKQIDKMFGNKRTFVAKGISGKTAIWQAKGGMGNFIVDKGNSEWEGWGTALKPAVEPIVVARKPLSEKNVALNVLKWGTGGINIDESRIGTEERTYKGMSAKQPELAGTMRDDNWIPKDIETTVNGRFPANIIFDEESAKMLDEQSGNMKSQLRIDNQERVGEKIGMFEGGWREQGNIRGHNDIGGASRFFYVAKASKSERNFGLDDFEEKSSAEFQYRKKLYRTEENKNYSEPISDRLAGNSIKYKNNHPTVKPIKLMEYLIKLVSREGSIVLDPFLGSGTTAIACVKNNRQFIGIEKESEYIKIAKARIKPYLEQRKLT